MKNVSIVATGSYLPERRVHNNELAERLPDTSHEWISTNTGIVYRHIVAEDEAVSDLAYNAGLAALEKAGVEPKDLGMILVATCTPDYGGFPSTACMVQKKLGAKHVAALDISAACSGFVYGLEVARGLLQFDDRPILLIGAEAMSRILDWDDYKTCVLFGDGAGAVVLKVEESDTPVGILDSYLGADGAAKPLFVDGGTRRPAEQVPPERPVLTMNGQKVFVFAVKAMERAIRYFIEKHNLTPDDIAYIVPHQANQRIINKSVERLGIPEDLFYLNLDKVANTSGASIPLALSEMDEKGMLKEGDLIITAGFGAGLTFGGNLIRWTKTAGS